MNFKSNTRTMNGAKYVMLSEQEVRQLLGEIEFKTGSWQDLQADYKRGHNRDLADRSLTGWSVLWLNYKGKTVYSQLPCLYEEEYKQNDLIYRKVYNALTKLATNYDMLELYEFARWGRVLRMHLIEKGIMKK